MGLVFYFLGFLLNSFHVLAWPSVALGYPLYASIRAVETNSKYHMRKLITYWIIFTLISLFELSLAHLIQWVPFWPHIKLIAIFLLVIPHFNGAFYIYQSVIHPCLCMDLQVAIRQLNKPNVRIYFNKDALLVETESYDEDNGSQVVTKLDCKEVKHVEGDLAQTEVETFASMVKGTAILPTNAESQAPEVPDSAKLQKEWNCAMCQVTTASEKTLKEHHEGKKQSNKCEEQKPSKPKAKNMDSSSVADISQTNQGLENKVKHAKGEHAQSGAKIAAAIEANLPATRMAHGEGSTNVQKEWNCIICQVTTSNQKTLDSHLRGKKHRSKCKQIEASKQAAKTKESSSSTASKSHNINEDSPDKVSKDGVKQSVLWCSICNERCPGEIYMRGHIQGVKHLSNLQQMNNLQRQPVDFYGGSAGVYLSKYKKVRI